MARRWLTCAAIICRVSNRWLLAITLLGTAAHVGAQSPPSESLPAPAGVAAEPALASNTVELTFLEQLALQNHPRIHAAWEDVRSAEGRTIQAGLYRNPQIGTASPQLAGPESQYNVFMSQDIITGGKLRLSAAAASQEIDQARLAAVRARFEVLTEVRRQFYSLLAAQNRVAVLQEMVVIGRKSQEIGQALLRGGEGARTDTLVLDVELSRAEVALQNAETVLATGKRQLAAAIGQPDLTIGILYGDLSAELPRLDIEGLQAGVIASNAQVGIAGLEVQQARILYDRAVVEPSPTFNVMGGYQYQVSPDVHSQGIAQVTMSVPLWDRNQGNIRSAQANLARAHADARRVEVTLAGQAAAALARYRSAVQLVERYTTSILPKSRESLQLTQQLYQRQQIDFLRLLQAQRTLNEVNLGYIDAQEARWTAAAEIANLLQVEQFP